MNKLTQWIFAALMLADAAVLAWIFVIIVAQ